MRYVKSYTSINASVQPLEAPKEGQFNNTLPSKGNFKVLEVWRNADAVCFDVDSTVCLDEGIDELSKFCGAGKAVAEWTARWYAFNRHCLDMPWLQDLSLFNPSLAEVLDFVAKRPLRISPGIDELVKKMRARNADVYLVSGGFRQMPVASALGIPVDRIFTNQLLFGSFGEFLFDTNEPTSKSGGNATAVQQIKEGELKFEYRSLVMIGDGATDLEACKPGGADLFICYAGVQLRGAVANKASWLVFNFKDLIDCLE
ncbi:unnamed protein product [Coffea canephora]|uniref:phosphoserine phosphatase n=1 Tax=Coffea canephora TaxID=49390 RepID=A0A068V3X9_COFCA|nr:unnamed protein product [Coffea canephora]